MTAPFLRDLPPDLARGVLRLLLRALDQEMRDYGAMATPALNAFLRELHSASLGPPMVPLNGTSEASPSILDWVTVDQAAEVIGSSTRWVRRLVCSGRLTARRVGRTWRIDARSLDEYRHGRTAA